MTRWTFAVSLILGPAVIFRHNIFSCIYLALLFIAPFIPQPKRSKASHQQQSQQQRSILYDITFLYIKLVIGISFFISIAHIVFQIVLFSAFANYDESIDYCNFIGRIYNLIGLHRYDHVSVWSALRLCGADFFVLIATSALHVIASKAETRQLEQERLREEAAIELENKRIEKMEKRERRMTEAGLSVMAVPIDTKALQERMKKKAKLQRASELAYYLAETIFLVFLCAAAILCPSMTSAAYFIYFLLIGVCLSFNRSLGSAYLVCRLILVIYVAVHFTLLFVYQMEIVRPLVPPDDLRARLFGLVDYVQTNCTTVRELDFVYYQWNVYAYPFVLLGLYFISVTLIRTKGFKAPLSNKETKKYDLSDSRMFVTVSQRRPSEVRSDNTPAVNAPNDWSRNNSAKRESAAHGLTLNLPSGDNKAFAIDDGEHCEHLVTDVMHLHDLGHTIDSTPLLTNDKTGKHYQTANKTSKQNSPAGGTLEMDPNGSIIWKPEYEVSNASACSVIGPSNSRAESPIGQQSGDQTSKLMSPFVQLLKLLKRGSYVGTLIVMMAWSITYHSWLSFILLLWSCIIWMMPNSRHACLKSAPALVLYSMFLLVGQYIYSLNLTDDELPTQIASSSVSMAEIGFKKYYQLSYQPLFIKLLYTIVFLITLRQFFEERKRDTRRQIAQGVIAPPFNIGYGTGQASVLRPDLRRQMSLATTSGTHQSPIVQWVIDVLKELMIKYWIWVVATMLMVMSLSGEKVVLFRIVYMFLFLTFVLLFQLSFNVWRRLIYPFWLVVIIYSMIILIAIYTYQFNRFPDYWRIYLLVDNELQLDLGLELYSDAWILFKELFTPTFFLIITIIQVHFLHKDFLEFSNFDKQSTITTPTSDTVDNAVEAAVNANETKVDVENESDSSVTTSTPNTVKSKHSAKKANSNESVTSFVTTNQDSPPLRQKISGEKVAVEQPIENEDNKQHNEMADDEAKNERTHKTSIEEIKEMFDQLWNRLKPILDSLIEILWRLLEIHIIKVVLLTAVYVAIADLSAMNTLFVIFVVLAMSLNQLEGIVSHLLGIWAGILILLKMLFQLHVAQNIEWHTNCTNIHDMGNNTSVTNYTVIDNREYIGFKKVDNIYSYIIEYIILILILVMRTVVILRQRVTRFKRAEQTPPPGIVFARVGRADADRHLKGLVMFLVNYGFYKFGVEVCFILLIASIGSRYDVFSVFYACWLLALVMLTRTLVERAWPYFVGFFAIILPLQYLLCLGIPEGLCIDYPWYSEMNIELRDWLFLPDFSDPPLVSKLYLDFLILLFSCRQLINFRIEKMDSNIGGSNLEAHLERKSLSSQNVPDFFAFGHTVLDSVKSLFFFCFFWITLAVVFLAGTTRVSLFALGYVLGCFMFLWNGNEFYLKPIEMVFRLWKSMIAYTSGVILIKAILQIVGCVYITSLYANFCWVVQLLGIACLGKYMNLVSSGKCVIPSDEAGLLWDGVCFAFLIIQKRIFCSYYFCHLIREIKAQQVLASRGAELIHEIQAKEVADQEQAEKEVMEKIKLKMDRIKAAQRKMYADKARSIKYHKQEDYEYDVSPYSTAEGTIPHTPDTEEQLSHTLPTVYSPTPSPPTVVSPQSATSPQPGYLEVYRVGFRNIDASSSTVTFPSISLKSSPTETPPLFSPPPHYPNITTFFTPSALRLTMAAIDSRSDASSIFQSSTRTQIPQHHQVARVRRTFSSVSRQQSLRRRPSSRSLSAAHGSSVRSGGYYMFDDTDSEIVDLNEKPRKSLIPDPEGDEMRRIAKIRGFTAFCSKVAKGEIDGSFDREATIVSEETTTEIGESSKDSAIVSVDRERVDPDASVKTTVTTLPYSTPTRVSSRPTSLPMPLSGDEEPQQREDGDLDGEERDEEEVEEDKESLFSKMKSWLQIAILFIESCLISATAKLNTLSRDYRYVARRLSVEKRYLKKLFEIEETNGSKYDFMDTNWKKRTLAKISQATVPKVTKSIDSVDDTNKRRSGGDQSSSKKTVISEEVLASIEVDLEDSYLRSSVYMRFVRSIFYAILSRSEVMCYIMVVLNQISSASVVSLPLPLAAFLWGSLSVPRPSKFFWVSVITYTEAIVVIKYIFQFQFWPWLETGDLTGMAPFYPPRILGIDKSDHYANYDLALLLVLFFHRFMLKSLGLWDLSETEMAAFMERAEKRASLSLDKSLAVVQENYGQFKKDMKPIKGDEKQLQITRDSSKDDSKCELESKAVALRDSSSAQDLDTVDSDMTPTDELREEMEEGFNTIYKLMSAPKTLKSTAIRAAKPIQRFFHSVLDPPYRITRDVYSLMFLCDFINFFILVFGFYAFGSGYSGDDVASFLDENKIPIPFLVTLLLQFALIIIDRALYLRKYITGKLMFQIFLTIAMHIWLFFALPAMTDRSFLDSKNWPPKVYYIFKCIYFLLSAYQIRSGYPTRILGNTFCKKYNLVNWYMFKGYMVIPFLYDLRMYMDWIWTDTSLVLDEWSLMEDIFVNLYERKCELKLDEEFPEPRGKPKRRFFKYLLGGAWVVIIIGLIWGPLGLFALGRAVGNPNPPFDVSFELELGGYQPLFRMSVTGTPIPSISNSLWSALKTNEDFKKDAVAQTFISGYDQIDVTVVNLNGNSTAIWGISPPSQEALERDLLSNTTNINIKLSYFITRKKAQKSQDMEVTISSERSRLLKYESEKDMELRRQLARMLSHEEEETQPAIIDYIFPNYLRVPEKGKPKERSELIKKAPDSRYPYNKVQLENYLYRSVGILLQKGSVVNGSMTSWWEVHDLCDDKHNKHLDQFFAKYLLRDESCRYLPVVLFNDKVFSGVLGFLSGYGIIGIYTTFVFLVSRWVRGLNSESSYKVIYTRMPNVDRVLQLCLDIYLVRESREFELEEDLYAKLIFLYRSPETLIKWTKPVEELSEEQRTLLPPMSAGIHQ